MARPVTLVTGQWADLPFEELCKKASVWGYDGLEIACWGDHMDVRKAASSAAYVRDKKRILKKYGLKCWALGAHLAGQCVGDDYDPRLDGFAPDAVKGKPDALRKWAVEEMKASARAARAMGCYVVNGFMGSPIWKAWYSFPTTTEDMVKAGYKQDPRALDADLRRVRRAGRQVRPRGPSDRDRLRRLHDAAAVRRLQEPG